LVLSLAINLGVRLRQEKRMAEVKVTFDAADDYERFMGRWSRAIGEQFLSWMAPPQTTDGSTLGAALARSVS
jgi:hypothetical protein